MGVETGGCPHTAIREDASMNLAAIEDMNRKFPHAELCFVESGGDNLAATFSPELAGKPIGVKSQHLTFQVEADCPSKRRLVNRQPGAHRPVGHYS
jgi:hypothetical protein